MKNSSDFDNIKEIYHDAAEWLKFLEAKHTALFAAWIAILIAIFSIDDFYAINIINQVIIVSTICLGLIINALALVPFLNNSKSIAEFIKKRAYEKYKGYGNNAVFYITIFTQTYNIDNNFSDDSLNKYKDILQMRNLKGLNKPLVHDYISQIIDVSTICCIKAYLFDLATRYLIVIIVFSIVAMIIA